MTLIDLKTILNEERYHDNEANKIDSEAALAQLPSCGHIFHAKCIQKLRTGACPLCRCQILTIAESDAMSDSGLSRSSVGGQMSTRGNNFGL